MRRLAIRSAAAPAWHTVLVIVLMALVGLPLAHALDVVRSQRALADVSTRLAPAPGAPSTTLRPQQPTGGLTPRTQDTTLQRNAGPQTILREAEVPKERLEQTRALLVELKARPTPEQAISIDLPADVLFDFDKADLRADAGPSLDKAAELIKSYASAPLTRTPASQSGSVSMTMTTSAMPELPNAAARAVSRSTPSTRLASNNISESRPALRNMQQIINAQKDTNPT